MRTFFVRGVAQLVARYVRDVEAASSSLVTPTIFYAVSQYFTKLKMFMKFSSNTVIYRQNVCLKKNYKTIFIFFVFLFGFIDLHGQMQNIETLSVEQCLKLADEKQREGNARDASFFLNTAADKCWEAEDYQKAIEYYNRSIKLNETISN